MRHNNQDRQVAPEQDSRLRILSEALARAGLPADFLDILAEGYVFRLRRRAWAVLSDAMGTGDDVEALCGWKGPPRALAKALELAGYLRDVKGVLLATDAVAEAPEYIKARWRRHDKAAYEAAAARVTPNTVKPVRVERTACEPDEWEEDTMPEETLFGPTPDVPPKDSHAESPFTKFSARWHERYQQVYGRKYAFRGADNRFIKQLIDALDSLNECYAVIDTFLADRSPYFNGHELRKLYTCLNQFRGKSQPNLVRNPGKSQATTGSVIARDSTTRGAAYSDALRKGHADPA